MALGEHLSVLPPVIVGSICGWPSFEALPRQGRHILTFCPFQFRGETLALGRKTSLLALIGSGWDRLHLGPVF